MKLNTLWNSDLHASAVLSSEIVNDLGKLVNQGTQLKFKSANLLAILEHSRITWFTCQD